MVLHHILFNLCLAGISPATSVRQCYNVMSTRIVSVSCRWSNWKMIYIFTTYDRALVDAFNRLQHMGQGAMLYYDIASLFISFVSVWASFQCNRHWWHSSCLKDHTMPYCIICLNYYRNYLSFVVEFFTVSGLFSVRQFGAIFVKPVSGMQIGTKCTCC
jgi:hypothetical protein